MELQAENLQVCGANNAAHWAHRSERDSSAQAAYSRAWDGLPGRRHPALSYLRNLENSAFQGLHSRPRLNRVSLKWTSEECPFLKQTLFYSHFKFLLKLSIFCHLKWKQHKVFKSVWPNAMESDFNYFWTTTMAGRSKQRHQGGRVCCSCAQLEGRQAGTMLQPSALCPHLFRGCCACPAGKLPQGPAPSPPSPKQDEQRS